MIFPSKLKARTITSRTCFAEFFFAFFSEALWEFFSRLKIDDSLAQYVQHQVD